MDNQPWAAKRPLFRGSLTFGLIFVLVGLLILYLFGQTSQLVCNRQADQTVKCSLTISVIGLILIHSAEVSGVQSARVGQDCSGTNCSYRVELLQANGLTPLTSYYSGGQTDKLVIADRINRALQDGSQQSFSVSTSLNLLVPLCAVLFAGVGVYGMFVPLRQRHHYH